MHKHVVRKTRQPDCKACPVNLEPPRQRTYPLPVGLETRSDMAQSKLTWTGKYVEVSGFDGNRG